MSDDNVVSLKEASAKRKADDADDALVNVVLMQLALTHYDHFASTSKQAAKCRTTYMEHVQRLVERIVADAEAYWEEIAERPRRARVHRILINRNASHNVVKGYYKPLCCDLCQRTIEPNSAYISVSKVRACEQCALALGIWRTA